MVLVLDLVATCIAYLAAERLRFGGSMAPWQNQLYTSVLIFALLAYVFAYTFRHIRGHFYQIAGMDAIENLVLVIRGRFLLYVMVLVFLVVTQSSGRVSRRFLLYMALIDVGVDYALRMTYRFLVRRTASQMEQAENRYLLVTSKKSAPIAVMRLRDGLCTGPGESAIAGIALQDFDEQQSAADNDAAKQSIYGERILGRTEDVLSNEFNRDRIYNRVFIYLPEAASGEIHQILVTCDRLGLTADVCLTPSGEALPRRVIMGGAGKQTGAGKDSFHYAAVEYSTMRECCRVLGVRFAVSNVDEAARFILGHLYRLKGKYICFCNVHTTVMAREDASYCEIQNGAAYTFADGAPVAAAERAKGNPSAERCAGPDFMDAVFRTTMDGSVTHYFYGSTPETLELLKKNLEQRYPGIRIAGMYSPPFRSLEETTKEEDDADVARINASGADLVWIGLGAPKQERWMALHEGKLNGTMLGVGAGFNFYAGNVKRAPKIIQKMGLEWLYRLFQDPKRLFRRYFVTNIKFLWYVVLDFLKPKK